MTAIKLTNVETEKAIETSIATIQVYRSNTAHFTDLRSVYHNHKSVFQLMFIQNTSYSCPCVCFCSISMFSLHKGHKHMDNNIPEHSSPILCKCVSGVLSLGVSYLSVRRRG